VVKSHHGTLLIGEVIMMIDILRWASAGLVSIGLVGLALASPIAPDEPPPRPRPGLTSQQTKEAVKLAQGAMVELRKKTEGASVPSADRREYVVGVELLSTGEPAPQAANDSGARTEGKASQPKPQENPKADAKSTKTKTSSGPLAIVTSYRYFDDITVFSTVDLETNRVVRVEAAQHLRTPLSQTEFDEAKEMARDKSAEVKELYERFGDQLSVYPQFSQFTIKDDPRVHRVVHLTYRVGKRDLSYPRPQVDLTLRAVDTPGPEQPEPEPKSRRRPR
jgi:hypothetical protein